VKGKGSHVYNSPIKGREYLDADRLDRRFDAIDTKGRRFGARVSFSRVEFVALPDDATSGWRREPGVYIVARPHATRNGVEYGASQREHYFDTLDQAQAWGEIYLAAAEKRALKNKNRAR
jgi:hypothetical protein